MLCCLNMKLCIRCRKHCTVWGCERTSWRRARSNRARVAKGMNKPELRLYSCGVTWSNTGRRFNKLPRTRRSSIGRSVNFNQENVEEAQTHRSPRVGAASLLPSWSNVSRWELRRLDSFHSSTVKSAGYMACSTSQWVRSSHPCKEQEDSSTRNRGHR